MLDELRTLWRMYRDNWIIAIGSTVLSLLIALILEVATGGAKRFILIVFVTTLVVLILLGTLLNLKRVISMRFSQINALLGDYVGLPAVENRYFIRRRHFQAEKLKLARVLVRSVLPDLVEVARHEKHGLARINLILDSGTTITPIFPIIMRLGIPNLREVELRVFTNNLAGIDEIHRIDTDEVCALKEEDFRLIGGTPLSIYRATTGTETQASLDIFLQEQPSSGCQVTIGVLTANWFLMRRGLDRISLCARRRGHHEFKEFVASHSDYIVLVAPLGKLLPLSEIDELNEIIRGHGEEYSTITPENKKTILLTSFRAWDSLSPLVSVSRRLKYMQDRQSKDCQNYAISHFSPSFDPPGDKEEVAMIDLPHDYIRHKAKVLFD